MEYLAFKKKVSHIQGEERVTQRTLAFEYTLNTITNTPYRQVCLKKNCIEKLPNSGS